MSFFEGLVRGYSNAQSEHSNKMLGMERDKHKSLADMYAKLAADDSLDPEIRNEYQTRAFAFASANPMDPKSTKSLKNLENAGSVLESYHQRKLQKMQEAINQSAANTPPSMYDMNTGRIDPNAQSEMQFQRQQRQQQVPLAPGQAEQFGLPPGTSSVDSRTLSPFSRIDTTRMNIDANKPLNEARVSSTKTKEELDRATTALRQEQTKHVGEVRPARGQFFQGKDVFGNTTEFFNPTTGAKVEAPSNFRSAPVSEAERSKAGEAKGMIGDLAELKQLATKHRDAIGPLSGNVNKALSKVITVPEDVAKLQQITQSLQNRLIYMRSGKQINEQEFKRLSATMPNMNQPAGQFFVNLERFEKEMGYAVSNNAMMQKDGGIANPPSTPKFAEGQVVMYKGKKIKIKAISGSQITDYDEVP